VLAGLPLPGGHETLPDGFRTGIRHSRTATNSTLSPGFVEEKEIFGGLRVHGTRCAAGITLRAVENKTTRG